MKPIPTTDLPPISTLHAPARRSAQRLRNTLRVNAATSLVAGLILSSAPGALDRILGTGHPGWTRVVGVGLVVFAADVAVVAGMRTTRLSRWSPAVVVADLVWVVASLATIAGGWFDPRGAVVVAATAAVVGTFAALQWRHLAGIPRSGIADIDERPPIEITALTTLIEAPADRVWPVITDHRLYARLAPNLSAVEATGPDGPDLTRTCTNRTGRQWDETCTLWDEGRRYEVSVDTGDYAYPLIQMRGAWFVEPDGDGGASIVGLQFAFQPEATLYGRAFALAMQLAFPPVLRRIARGWRREVAESIRSEGLRAA